MKTPIFDFVNDYSRSKTVRFHMPGHKGRGELGIEKFDITEIKNADFLYQSSGIISESENIASELFGSRKTCYSTEGSSQCIRAMLFLAVTQRKNGALPLIVAARNAHKAFIYAAATIGFDIKWIYPEKTDSLCRCDISRSQLENALKELTAPPAAVYVTGVDYLGNIADISALAEVCHRYKTVLAVDNAHGAYLHFLKDPIHPLDLGADICCDSAHKTFPVLTGGAYLHIGKNAPESFSKHAKSAMELFGSTSPSYLTMASLDLCNKYLSDGYSEKLSDCVKKIAETRLKLKKNGWEVCDCDPLRIVIKAPKGLCGTDIANTLRENGIECEYADRSFVVLMATPQNIDPDFEKLVLSLKNNSLESSDDSAPMLTRLKCAMSVREAMFRPKEKVKASDSIGRICALPTVSCPPAIPIAVTGEIIDKSAEKLFDYYDIDEVEVIL